MQLEKNTFAHALVDGEKQVGVWVSLCSPFAAEVVAPAGFDWALLDMEHTPNEYSSVLGQLQVFASSNTTAIVRPEWNNPVVVKRLLDMGVPGLLFPMIQTVEEAELAVASTRYPPAGIRGFSGATRATKFGRVSDYTAKVEQETAVLLQLESADAIGIADAISDVEGVSGIFFGPADIAADIGLLGQPLHDDVWALIKPAARMMIDKGMPVGTLVNNAEFAAELFEFGFSYVACGTDTIMLARASDALLADVKSKLPG